MFEETLDRAKQVRALIYLLMEIRSRLPILFGRKSTLESICSDLVSIYQDVVTRYGVALSDFPKASFLKPRLLDYDFESLAKIKPKELQPIEEAISSDFRKIADELDVQSIIPTSSINSLAYPNVALYSSDFGALRPRDGQLSGSTVKSDWLKRSQSKSHLHAIWQFSDLNGDGQLNLFEYAIGRTLIALVDAGGVLPRQLPSSWTIGIIH